MLFLIVVLVGMRRLSPCVTSRTMKYVLTFALGLYQLTELPSNLESSVIFAATRAASSVSLAACLFRATRAAPMWIASVEVNRKTRRNIA